MKGSCMLILKRAIVCAFFVFLFSILSFADPVRITSGTVNNLDIKIAGNGVTYNFEASNGFAVTPGSSSAYTYRPGAVPLIGIEAFNRLAVPGSTLNANYIGTAVINGQSYFTQLGADGGFYNSMIFTSQQAIALPSTIPPLPTTGGPAIFTTTVPFSMVGTLQGGTCVNSSIPCVSTPLVSIYGNGTATYTFTSGGDGLWRLSSYSYEFSSAEPTPEPATLLLFGTGIAGLAGYAAKRRKKKAEPGT